MLPTGRESTIRIVPYAAEVGGRLLGVASIPNLLPDEEKRAALGESGNRIIESTRGLIGAYTTAILFEYLDRRIAVGRGKGVDRGWDRTVATVASRTQAAVPDRNTGNPEYREIFSDGTISEFTAPSIKQDPDLAAQLRGSIESSGLTVRDELIGLLDTITPLIEPAAAAVREGEEQTQALSSQELAARTALVDLLWTEQKSTEALLGRSGRAMVRFLFYNFQKSRSSSGEVTPPIEDPTEPEPTA